MTYDEYKASFEKFKEVQKIDIEEEEERKRRRKKREEEEAAAAAAAAKAAAGGGGGGGGMRMMGEEEYVEYCRQLAMSSGQIFNEVLVRAHYLQMSGMMGGGGGGQMQYY